MKGKLAIIFAIVGATVLGGITVTAQPAMAIPTVQICNSATNQLVCMNRQGGGRGTGTHVIGWHPGDNNNDFEWKQENDIAGCGKGQVSAANHCPFVNQSWNQTYDGSVIVRIWSYDVNLCVVGTYTYNGYERGTLQGCNDLGHVYVLVGCTQIANCGFLQFNTVINTYASDTEGGLRCVSWDTNAIGNGVITNDDCTPDASSNFQESYFV